MYLAIFHNQPPGGARRLLYEVGRQLAQRHRLKVFTLSSADETSMSSRDFAERVITVPYSQRPHVRLGFYLNDLRSWLSLRDLDTTSHEVAQRINDGAFDAVLVDVDRYLGAPFVLRYLEVPNVYYCHEPPRRFTEPICKPSALPLSPWERARLVWRWPADYFLGHMVQRAELVNAQHAGQILTNSLYNREHILRYYNLDAAVCYPGVDSYFFCPDDAMERRHEVLSVGVLEPHKGFEFLLRALARCSTKPRLRIVGNTGHPRMGQYLLTLATQLEIELEIETGISDSALRDRYRQAALVAYTPHSEPFGLVPLEAMACETPVVGVDEGGVRESITHGVTGWLVPRDEEAAAGVIDELIADGPRQRAMGRAGRADVVARWTWAAAAARIEQHIEAEAGAR